MKRVFQGLLFATLAISGFHLHAQEGGEQGITILQSGVDELYSDLKMVLETSGDDKSWKKLSDYMDGFVIGTNRKAPIVGRIQLSKENNGNTSFKQLWQFPLDPAQKDAFLKNINNLDVKTKEVRGQMGLYRVSGAFSGYMRIIEDHACFAEDRDGLEKTFVPASKLASLKGQDADITVSILSDIAGQSDRKQAMDEASKNLLAEIVAKKGEDPERFKLRKKWVEQQMEEMTRFYVEAARIHLNWFTKVPEKNASLHLELQALAGTPLAGSVDELGKVAGTFSGVPHAEDQPLSLHVNFPLDQLRQDNIREMAQLAHPIALKEIGEDKELSDSQKKHATTVSNVMNDIVEEVVKAKVLDTFVNVTGTDKQVAVGGLKLNGAAIRASLEKHKGDAEVKFDIEKVGDVAIHSIKIPADQAELLDVFGKDAVFHLATGQNAIWYSIGEGGTAALKQAIEQSAKPADKPLAPILMHGKVSKLATLVDKFQSRKKKGDATQRKAIVDAINSADDKLAFSMTRDADKVVIDAKFNEGLIKAAGKIIAKQVKELPD
ncbi:MAG: hypothetical protein U0903_17935 [Planctomycetales bacterium]